MPDVDLSYLNELQATFQKEAGELIDFYLQDATKKIANLFQALQETDLDHFKEAARELRYRSIDIGAIDFSYTCLSVEIAAQEIRLDLLPNLILLLKKKFESIHQTLTRIKQSRTD